MTALSYQAVSRLLAEPSPSGEDLLAAAGELRDSFVRNEHLLGLLPADASVLLVAALERAGRAGVVGAWLELGRLLAYGAASWAPYPERDIHASIEAYQQADRAGSRDGALGWVRVAYFTNSHEYALDAARRVSALLTATPDDPEALVLAGYMTSQGYGCSADPVGAVGYHRAAAELGSADGAFEMSVMYGTGTGVPTDQDESVRWTLRAAELGSNRAMANLAGMYATGRGLDCDPARALDWYSRAASAGNPKAAWTAGVMCLVGDGGLPVDDEAADRFFDIAEQLGFDVDAALDGMGLSRGGSTVR